MSLGKWEKEVERKNGKKGERLGIGLGPLGAGW
jgi:hypothetical protein